MGSKGSYEREFYKLSRLSYRLEMAAFLGAATSGILYLHAEQTSVVAVTDTAFVFLLLTSTLILLVGERYTRSHFLHAGLEFFAYSLEVDLGAEVFREHLAVSKQLFLSRNRIATGIVWGAILALGPYLLGVWSGHFDLRLQLALFVFFVNYITGNAVYTLVRFLISSATFSKMIKIDVWNSRNPSTAFYIQSILQVALFACAYVSVSMSSILFSKFDRTFIVYAYAALSFGIMLVTLTYPYASIARRLSRAKRDLQYRIGRRLHILTDSVLTHSDRPESDVVLEEMRRLMELRKSVDGVDVLPFKSISISVFTLMAFIFSHPFVLEWALGSHSLVDSLRSAVR